MKLHKTAKSFLVILVVTLVVFLIFFLGTGISINETNFPDRYFCIYVKLNLDTNQDGALNKIEIMNAKEINISRGDLGGTYADSYYRADYPPIQSLQGIEYFTHLETLNCFGQELVSLDLKNNKELKYLDCRFNQLTSLDVSNNRKLKLLICDGNQISNLNVTQNHLLETLWCRDNLITNLDLSNNEHLMQDNILCDTNVGIIR